MAMTIDLSTTFVHLEDGGAAEPIEVTRSFYAGKGAERYDRLVGVVDFEAPEDLHSSVQEMHPDADELIFAVSGAVDVVLEQSDGEQVIALEAGRAAIVPRGVWHRLVARQAGRLLFINSRSGMRSRSR